MQHIEPLTQFMGGPAIVGTPRTEFELIDSIRAGFPSQVINAIVRSSSVSEEVIYKALRIAKRTAARRKAESSPLKPHESELIYRLRCPTLPAEAAGLQPHGFIVPS